MSPRQSVQTAFRFQEIEPVPYWLQWDKSLESGLDDYFGSTAWRDRVVPYVVGHHFGELPITARRGQDQGVPGAILHLADVLHVGEPVLPEASLEGYRWPEPDDLIDWGEIEAFFEPY